MDFEKISGGSPLASLPVDPVNTTSSGLYYTYVGYGDPYELTALFESSKYQAQAAEDGGPDPATYEVGSDLTLSPFTHGLVGYWPLDEGSGTIAYDQSGFGNNGTWGGTATGTSGYYSPGLNQTWAGAFDGTTTDIIGSDITVPADFTIVAWTLQVASSGQETIFSNRNGGVLRLGTGVSGGKNMILLFDHNASPIGVSGGMYPTGQWQFVAVARTPSVAEIYLNGTSVVSQIWSGYSTSTGYLEIGRDPVVGQSWNGFIEDVRVYNRALSASEIQAIYNSEK